MDEIFTVAEAGDYTVIEFHTESLMNPNELERVAAAMYRLVDEERRHRLLLDFTRVKYLTSQAIGIVLTMNKKLMKVKGSKFVLCGVGQALMQLLKITRLDKILTIKASQQEALGAGA